MVNGLLVQRLGWMRKNMYRSESFFYKLGPFSYTLVFKNKLNIYNDIMIYIYIHISQINPVIELFGPTWGTSVVESVEWIFFKRPAACLMAIWYLLQQNAILYIERNFLLSTSTTYWWIRSDRYLPLSFGFTQIMGMHQGTSAVQRILTIEVAGLISDEWPDTLGRTVVLTPGVTWMTSQWNHCDVITKVSKENMQPDIHLLFETDILESYRLEHANGHFRILI